MISTQHLVNYDEGCQFDVIIDSDKLTLELAGTRDNDFKQKYSSLSALEKDYQERVVPYLKKCDAYDIDRRADAEILSNLAVYFAELRATKGRRERKKKRNR